MVHCPVCNDEMLSRNSRDLYCFTCKKFFSPGSCNQEEIYNDDEQSRIVIENALEEAMTYD
jgi:hypothetical protein